jgi:hypothetical protein
MVIFEKLELIQLKLKHFVSLSNNLLVSLGRFFLAGFNYVVINITFFKFRSGVITQSWEEDHCEKEGTYDGYYHKNSKFMQITKLT